MTWWLGNLIRLSHRAGPSICQRMWDIGVGIWAFWQADEFFAPPFWECPAFSSCLSGMIQQLGIFQYFLWNLPVYVLEDVKYGWGTTVPSSKTNNLPVSFTKGPTIFSTMINLAGETRKLCIILCSYVSLSLTYIWQRSFCFFPFSLDWFQSAWYWIFYPVTAYRWVTWELYYYILLALHIASHRDWTRGHSHHQSMCVFLTTSQPTLDISRLFAMCYSH